MIENRSVPPDTILPHVRYQNVEEAIAWLSRNFGFSEHYRYGDPVNGAQMHLGNAWIMVNQAHAHCASPEKLGYGTQSLTVFVDEVEAHHERSKAAGVRLVEDLHETEYGELQYGAEDLDGHHWLFSRHAHDRSPEEWGAKIVKPAYRLALLGRPRVCYLQMPAVDAAKSAAFYEDVFGWNIRHRNTPQPSFDDATGNVSGMWCTDRKAVPDGGILVYIWVDNIAATLARVAACGGAAVEPPHPDSPGSTSQIATFRDPAGNLIGLYLE